MTSIGLVAALPREIPARFVRVAVHEESGGQSLPFYQRTCGSFHMIAVQSGIGHKRAAVATRLLVHRFTPQALVSFGFAGGLLPGMAPGTLIIGEQFVQEGEPCNTPLEADQELVAQFAAAARGTGLLVQQGRMITATRLIADIPAKADLAQRSGACAVDMETVGIAEVARESGLAWVAVRVVVDTAEEALPAACLSTLRADGRVALGPLVRLLWRSPRLLLDFVWLGCRTRMARRCLSQVLERWSQQQPLPYSGCEG